MAFGGVPSLKELTWQSVRAQILADINMNVANWAIHTGSLVRNPPLALPPLPFRIFFCPASQAPLAPIPNSDATGLEVLSAVIPDASLPVPLQPVIFYFPVGFPWYDIHDVAI
jgi:hypothetical protein